ncbi:hypothetical protein GCM10025857_39300 [Alicyclobacillus contaminans]|nr:hypothetical protein GCM10025857_39300 [Alicyclobacillus contaminans]
MITRPHCRRFIGRPVVIRTRDGMMHRGILHTVTSDGIYVRPVGGATARLASETDVNPANIDVLQNMAKTKDDVEKTFFHFSSSHFLR